MDSIGSTLPASYYQATPGEVQSQDKAKDSQNQFLQLLVAQLKGQDPLNPMEGSAFVAQLAQFSSLEELTKIRSSMDTVRQLLTQSSTDANQTKAL